MGGRVALYRRRRGLSQKVLAELVGRSESWLSQVKRGILPLENLNAVLRLAEVLRVEPTVLTGSPLRLAPNGGVLLEEVEALRRRSTARIPSGWLLSVADEGDLPSLSALETDIPAAWAIRHQSRYRDLANLLPDLLRRAEIASEGTKGRCASARTAPGGRISITPRPHAEDRGDPVRLGGRRRGMQAARLAGLPLSMASGARALATVFAAQGRLDDAENVVSAASRGLESDLNKAGEPGWSAWGALMLRGASSQRGRWTGPPSPSICARRTGPWTASTGLARSSNQLRSRERWHTPRLGLRRLGDAGEAIRTAGELDLSGLPEMFRERRSVLLIDVARAYGQRRNKGAAVLHLLEAERVAGEEVRWTTSSFRR